MRTIKYLVPVLILMAATCVTAAPNILLFNMPAPTAEHYPAALNALGYAFTETKSVPDFYAALTGGTEWDLVLVDNYDGIFDDSTLVSLMNYIAKGGRCALSHWDMDWALAGIFGANMQLVDYKYTTPIPVLRWEPAHSIFTTPNAIPDLTPVEDPSPATVDGFYLQPHDDATAVAGYTTAATDYQAAIIIGNEGRTILLGITPELFGPDMEKLLENCIEYLFAHTPSLSLTLNPPAPAIGSPFTIDVAVQPITQRFDAWGVILGPNNVSYSFTLGKPGKLQKGAKPLATNVRRLAVPHTRQLLSIASMPANVAGDYTIIVELVPAGIPPFFPIGDYSSVKKVTVQ